MDFYHNLAPHYDQMINFDERFDKELSLFQAILARYPAASALDAGCGSGFHSIVLSRLGLRVSGIDKSEDMLALAGTNARRYQTNPLFIQADFLTAAEVLGSKFDSVFCLGNSFVHLLTADQQMQALNSFKNCLRKGGYLCLQMVNYDKFLHEKKTALSVKNNAEMRFTRTYTYHAPTITFHIEVKKNGFQQRISTELYPLFSQELLALLDKCGFMEIRLFGNLKLEPYKRLISENCCCFCVSGGA